MSERQHAPQVPRRMFGGSFSRYLLRLISIGCGGPIGRCFGPFRRVMPSFNDVYPNRARNFRLRGNPDKARTFGQCNFGEFCQKMFWFRGQ